MTATKRAYVEILHNRHDEFMGGRDIYGPFDTMQRLDSFVSGVAGKRITYKELTQ